MENKQKTTMSCKMHTQCASNDDITHISVEAALLNGMEYERVKYGRIIINVMI